MGTYALAGGLPEVKELTDDTPQFIKEYCDFYKCLSTGYFGTLVKTPLLQIGRSRDRTRR
ncbi:MAG: hypothetical protein ACI4CA_06735 [Bacteroides sp.]